MKKAIYIYGVIKTSEPQVFGEIGIGDGAASKVQTLGFEDIAAVISYNELTVYDAVHKEKVVRDLAVHQLVIEKVMKQFTIVPVKFATMVETEDEVIKYLEKGYTLLNKELDKAKGKIELDVVAWWELPKILPTIVRRNEQIQTRQQDVMMKGEAVSEDEKIMLGQLVEQALKAEKARYQQMILQTLKQEVIEECSHEVAGDKMILNTAFLLEKKNEKSFDTAINDLDQRLEGTVKFRVVGPLPLYSFSTIVLKKIAPEIIEEAKKTLGLTGEVADKTLRDAYYQLSRRYHPDKRSGDGSTEFERIHDAFTMLKDFVENGSMYVEVYQWKGEMQ